MYVCNCNGITERQVKAAVRKGIKRWDDVHTHYGYTPQCGKCRCDISKYIDEDAAGRSLEDMASFASPVMAT